MQTETWGSGTFTPMARTNIQGCAAYTMAMRMITDDDEVMHNPPTRTGQGGAGQSPEEEEEGEIWNWSNMVAP